MTWLRLRSRTRPTDASAWAATVTRSVRIDLDGAWDDLRDGVLDLRRGRLQRAAAETDRARRDSPEQRGRQPYLASRTSTQPMRRCSRPGHPRRRTGGASRGGAAGRGHRSLRVGQVLPRPSGSAGGAGRRQPPRQQQLVAARRGGRDGTTHDRRGPGRRAGRPVRGNLDRPRW
jgi:hypothetical protein